MSGSFIEYAKKWVEVTASAIEALAVIIIVGAILYGTIRYILQRNQVNGYRWYKVTLGKGLLLGLEILVAADVVRTIALNPTIAHILGLGLLVLIRTFLSWSLVVEMESRWPWQPKPAGDQATG